MAINVCDTRTDLELGLPETAWDCREKKDLASQDHIEGQLA